MSANQSLDTGAELEEIKSYYISWLFRVECQEIQSTNCNKMVKFMMSQNTSCA